MPAPITKTVIGNVRAKGGDVLLTNMYFGDEKTAGGIILTSDDGIERGIRPRWAQVYSIGPNFKDKDAINVGDWVLMEHARWGRGVLIEDSEGTEWVIRKADTDCILMVSEEEPAEVGEWLQLAQQKTNFIKKQKEARDQKSEAPSITIRKAPKPLTEKE